MRADHCTPYMIAMSETEAWDVLSWLRAQDDIPAPLARLEVLIPTALNHDHTHRVLALLTKWKTEPVSGGRAE